MNGFDGIEREPAWLASRVDQLLAKLNELGGPVLGTMPSTFTVLLMLEEADPEWNEEQFEKWDKSCANCSKQESVLYGNVRRKLPDGKPAVITFAACIDCLNLP